MPPPALTKPPGLLLSWQPDAELSPMEKDYLDLMAFQQVVSSAPLTCAPLATVPSAATPTATDRLDETVQVSTASIGTQTLDYKCSRCKKATTSDSHVDP